MTLPTPLSLCVIACVLVLLTGCKPPPESVRVKEQVVGPPDLVKTLPSKPGNRAFQIRAFHLNHIWSATSADRAYRAKVTVWDYADDESAVAELYFDDTVPESAAANPDPAKSQRPYKVHFPIAALGPILNTLRNTNEPIFLYYYDGAWSLGIYTAEPVGVD